MEQRTTTDQYRCNECKDSQWVLVEKDGRQLYKPCDCRKRFQIEARMKSLIEQNKLLGSLRQKSFENYFPRTRRQKDALAKVKAGGSFFIIGPWGTGK